MGADNVFFTLFPEISTPLELDAHMVHLDNRVAKVLLRHLDLSLGGSGTGVALQNKWTPAELENTPVLSSTLNNWRLAVEAQDEQQKCQVQVMHWARLMHSESIRLCNSGLQKSPALPFPICETVIVPDCIRRGVLTTKEECKDLAYQHTPYERITWNSDITPIPRPRVSFLQRAQCAAAWSQTPTPHTPDNV
jgi:hypothetical protein